MVSDPVIFLLFNFKNISMYYLKSNKKSSDTSRKIIEYLFIYLTQFIQNNQAILLSQMLYTDFKGCNHSSSCQNNLADIMYLYRFFIYSTFHSN